MWNDLVNDFATTFGSSTFETAYQYAVLFSPIWLPIFLISIFWPLWVNYVRAAFLFSQKYILLEVRLPKETVKSPLAMELFLTTLHQTSGESTWFDRKWLGKVRAYSSLELVSIEGQIRFFIWIRAGLRGLVESGLYAQFPGIEVFEAPDYTKSVHFDPKVMNVWGCDWKLTKPDPYPIKTYIDYGLDKDPKEELKVDPMTNLLEFLSQIGTNQQVWIQLIIRAHKDEDPKPGHFWATTDSWKDQAKKEIEKIREESTTIRVDKEGNELPGFPNPTPGERDKIAALERSLSKLAFDVGMRTLYLAKKDNFNGANIPGMLTSFKQFNSPSLNGFAPTGWSTEFNFPWQDFKEIRQNKMRTELFEAYKRRSFYFPPFIGKKFVLNTEEIATIYHFPGQVSQAPSLARLGSKKAEPPANLPI